VQTRLFDSASIPETDRFRSMSTRPNTFRIKSQKPLSLCVSVNDND
jgi:hypothetical protein